MILLKIFITILVVTTLSVVAERAGPRIAGILAGYPAGSAISLFFIGLEIGPQFSANGALFNIAGMTALLGFLGAYYLFTERLRKRGFWLSAGVSALTSGAVFILSAYLISTLPLAPWTGIVLTIVSLPFAHHLFKRIANSTITTRVRLGPRVLLFRAGLSAVVIITVTGAAHFVSDQWAGLFTAFPATIFPLILIVQRTYGTEQAHAVIKNIPMGLWALVFYSATIAYGYPIFGIYSGTLLAFCAATVYLGGLAAFQALTRPQKTNPRTACSPE